MIYKRYEKCFDCLVRLSQYTGFYKVENIFKGNYYEFWFKYNNDNYRISVPYATIDNIEVKDIENKIFETYTDLLIKIKFIERIEQL